MAKQSIFLRQFIAGNTIFCIRGRKNGKLALKGQSIFAKKAGLETINHLFGKRESSIGIWPSQREKPFAW